jgi:hypothetical protein
LEDFEFKLNRSAERIFSIVKPGGILAVLIGDKRKEGKYYALFRTMLTSSNIGELKSIIIKIQHNCRSDERNYNSKNPFLVPIKHEYCLIFQKK